MDWKDAFTDLPPERTKVLCYFFASKRLFVGMVIIERRTGVPIPCWCDEESTWVSVDVWAAVELPTLRS